MALVESSRLWTTGGAGDGSATYTRDNMAELFRNALLADFTTQGVLNGLAVSGSASPLTLATGAACVYGFLYFCTTSGTMGAITTPAVGTTGGRVSLRADWTAQTVRVVAVRNTDGVSAIPNLTQVAGTTWDIPLATFTITTGGVITLTDARAFVANPSKVFTSGRIPFATTGGQLTDDAGLRYSSALARLQLQSTAPGWWLDETNDATKGLLAILANGVLTFFKTATNFGLTETTPFQMDIINGQQTITPAASNPPLIIGANGQGQRVAGLVAEPVGTLGLKRQGGSATDWTAQGTSTQTLSTTDGARVEVGTIRWSGSAATSGFVDITFPTAFSQPPIVLCQQGVSGASDYFAQPASITASGFRINWKTVSGSPSATTIDFMWIAIGPQ